MARRAAEAYAFAGYDVVWVDSASTYAPRSAWSARVATVADATTVFTQPTAVFDRARPGSSIPLIVYRPALFNKHGGVAAYRSAGELVDDVLGAVASWRHHPSRKVEHTGWTPAPVRAFSFACRADMDAPTDPQCATRGEATRWRKCACRRPKPLVRRRSTLLSNPGVERRLAPLLALLETAHDDSLSTAARARYVAAGRRLAPHGLTVGNSRFSTVGVMLDFTQRYHIDRDDLRDSLCIATYRLAAGCRGGELVFPEHGVACMIRDGDVVLFQSQTLFHGVAPIVCGAVASSPRRDAATDGAVAAEGHRCNAPPQRAAILAFVTEDAAQACIRCVGT